MPSLWMQAILYPRVVLCDLRIALIDIGSDYVLFIALTLFLYVCSTVKFNNFKHLSPLNVTSPVTTSKQELCMVEEHCCITSTQLLIIRWQSFNILNIRGCSRAAMLPRLKKAEIVFAAMLPCCDAATRPWSKKF